MPKLVYELRGSGAGIETATDGALIFPNVSSCMAVVAQLGSSLAGAHVTLADAEKLEKIKTGLAVIYPGASFYIAGHLDNYDTAVFANARSVKVTGNVDIMMKVVGGQLYCYTRSAVGISGSTTEDGFIQEQWS